MTDYAVVLLYPPGYEVVRALAEVAESVHYALIELGHDSVTSHWPVPDRQNIVFGANNIEMINFELESNSILYNLEWIDDPNSWWIHEDFIAAHKKYRVWDFCEHNVEAFKRYDINVENVLPIGYVKPLTRISHREPDIDVLFVGSITERRSKIMQDLEKAGLKACQVYRLWGPQRDQLIARSKVILNIQSTQPKIFEMVRVSYYMANQCAVVSEMACNHEEFLDYQSAIEFCEYDKMVEKTIELCKNDQKRLHLAQSGFDIFSGHKLVDYLKRVL